MSDALTLFSDAPSASPWAMSCFVALEEKGLRYELVKVALDKGEHHRPTYQARTGRVPSLRHGDFVLAESSAIIEYLDDAFPAPGHPALLPSDLRQRATAREVMAWLRSDLQPLREERPTSGIFHPPASAKPLSERARAAADRLLSASQGLVSAGRLSLFDAWCIADLDLSLMLQRLLAHGDAVPPHLADYARATWSRPSVERWLSLPR